MINRLGPSHSTLVNIWDSDDHLPGSFVHLLVLINGLRTFHLRIKTASFFFFFLFLYFVEPLSWTLADWIQPLHTFKRVQQLISSAFGSVHILTHRIADRIKPPNTFWIMYLPGNYYIKNVLFATLNKKAAENNPAELKTLVFF